MSATTTRAMAILPKVDARFTAERGYPTRRAGSNRPTDSCREYIICPLPRASDLSASSLRPVRVERRIPGGFDVVSRRRLGAGHARARNLVESAQRRAALVPG